MKIEQDLQDNEARVVAGWRGAKGRSFARKFRNAAAMERWLESDAARDVEIYEIKRAG